MAESNTSTESLSPLKPKPFAEVFAELGITNSKWPSAKKKECDSPLELIPLADVIEMTQQAIKNNLLQRNNQKSLASGTNQRPITFKVPKKLSLSKIDKKLITSKSNVTTNSGNRETKRFTTISSNNSSIRTKSGPQVRKELFSATVSSTTPLKAKNRKISRIPEIHINSVKIKKAMEQDKSSGGCIKNASSVTSKKDVVLKLSTSSIDDFELAEASCNVQSPSAVSLMEDLQHMQDLHTKLNALTLEMNEVWPRIFSGVSAACAKANGVGLKSPFSKVASAKKVNLLKSTLLKTVKEMRSLETAATRSDAEEKIDDAKMTESISMYNAMRGHVLRTPKGSRKSLEKGDSISTTVQKQCLMLMQDTPKVRRKHK